MTTKTEPKNSDNNGLAPARPSIPIRPTDNFDLGKCDICKKSLDHPDCLSKHEPIHIGEQPTSDKLAEFHITMQKSMCSAHQQPSPVQTCDISNPQTCGKCKKSFCTDPNLATHDDIHTKEVASDCKHCASFLCQITDPQKHGIEHAPRTKENSGLHASCWSRLTKETTNLPFPKDGPVPPVPASKCDSCNKSFFITTNVKKHVKPKHAPPKPPFQCRVCNKQFPSNNT